MLWIFSRIKCCSLLEQVRTTAGSCLQLDLCQAKRSLQWFIEGEDVHVCTVQFDSYRKGVLETVSTQYHSLKLKNYFLIIHPIGT